MDINVILNNIKLNLRSAVVIETKIGYIFEWCKNCGIYHIVGGGIQINESSEEAARREIFEEIKIKLEDIRLIAIVERFYKTDEKNKNEGRKIHGIEFFYYCKSEEIINLPEGFHYLNLEQIKDQNIEPMIIKLIENKEIGIKHIRINK